MGAYFPELFNTVFPSTSLDNLKIISNIGLILFMFVVGMELDLRVLKTKVHEAVVISHASIIFPFVLGMGLAYYLYNSFAPDGIPFLSFALFMGISMSITAFPVLARIVREKGINKTKLGTIILTCAAVDDITAWCVLAIVIAIVKAGTVVSSFYTILFSILYVIVMIKVVRPFLQRMGELHTTKEHMNKSIVAVFFLVLIASALMTEIIGIHALFGAFMAGTIMPDNKAFRHVFVEKVEDIATVLLLPLFFVEREPEGGCPDEYPWIDGAGGHQHRVRPGRVDSRNICHDGDNGAGNHVYDIAQLKRDQPVLPRERKGSESCCSTG